MVAARFALGALHGVLSPHAYLWLVAVWAVVCASFAVGARRFMQDEQLEPVPPKAGA